MTQEFNPFSVTVTTKLSEKIDAWQKYLLTERRLSDLTGKSYLFDLKEFFDFLFHPKLTSTNLVREKSKKKSVAYRDADDHLKRHTPHGGGYLSNNFLIHY